MLAQITTQPHPPGWWIAVVVVGIIAFYVFIKIEHVIVRLISGFIGLVLVAAVLWWLFFRH